MSRLEEGGRIAPDSAETPYERALFARHIFAYAWAAENFIEPGDKVLELGSGEGYGSALLAGKAASVTATDAADDAVAHAAAKYPAANLRFLTHAGGRLPFADGEFDKVVSFQVIEHVQDDAGFAAEAARVLKPGGEFLVTTPNREFRMNGGKKPWYKFHVREYLRPELETLLRRSFAEAEVSFITAPPEVFELEIRVAKTAALAQRLDPLGLRDLVPYSLKQLVFGLMGGRRPGPAGPEYRKEDFSVSSSNERGLDLIARAKKL